MSQISARFVATDSHIALNATSDRYFEKPDPLDQQVDRFVREVSLYTDVSLSEDWPEAARLAEETRVDIRSHSFFVESNWVYDQLREGPFSLGHFLVSPARSHLVVNLPERSFDWIFSNGIGRGKTSSVDNAFEKFECYFDKLDENLFRLLRIRFGGWDRKWEHIL